MVRVMKKRGVPVAVEPWRTLGDLLVRPRDRRDGGDMAECVYRVPCAGCDGTYVGETGGELGVGLHGHGAEVGSRAGRACAGGRRTAGLTECCGSALAGRAGRADRAVDWRGTAVIGGERDRPAGWIREAVHVRKEGHRAMNRDEGSYQLSHAYDRFLDATADRRIKTRKN